MLRHYTNTVGELIAVFTCGVCHQSIEDLDFAEIVWKDRPPNESVETLFGHTHCTEQFDEDFVNNMNAKEYLEKLI